MSEDTRSGFTGTPIGHKVRRSAPIIWREDCLKNQTPVLPQARFLKT